MSLARQALRLCTVRALRGHTSAGDRVRDSEQGPVEDYVKDKTQPHVLVYTDDGVFGAKPRDLFDGGSQDLVIEIVMTQRMVAKFENGEEGETIDMPQTDAAMEFSIDAIARQVRVALMRPADPWAEMWRRFALSITQGTDKRGSSMREGVRFAGRQMLLTVDLPRDPVPGQPLGPLWADFLALVEGTADLAPIAAVMRALIEGGDVDLPDWQVLRAGYGMTLAEARALQVAPPAAAEASSPDFEGVTPDTHPSPPGTLP